MIEVPATVIVKTFSEAKRKQNILFKIETSKEASDIDQTLSTRRLYVIDLTSDGIDAIGHKSHLIRQFSEVNDD